jgi:hypothetical protein
MRNNSTHQSSAASSSVDLTSGTGNVPEINILVNDFFENTSFDDSEDILSDLIQMYVNPDPSNSCTPSHLSNLIYGVRNITNLLRKLEYLNNQVKGGVSCA